MKFIIANIFRERLSLLIKKRLLIVRGRREKGEEWRLIVYDFITKERKVFGPGPFCIEPGYGESNPELIFSRDSKKIFYINTVFIHPAEEQCFIEQCTEKEIKEMEKRIKEIKQKTGAGLRMLDLEQGQDILLLPFWTEDWSLPIFYNNPQINLKEKIFWQKKNELKPKIEIKKLQSADFDYLLQKQIDQLPTLLKVETENPDDWSSGEMTHLSLSKKGDGFFYITYPLGYSGRENKEMGFLEIKTKKNYFPLPFSFKKIVVQKEGFGPQYYWPLPTISAFSKEALFYFVQFAEYEPEELRAKKTQLYRISIDDKEEMIEELIDEAPYGFFIFIGFTEFK